MYKLGNLPISALSEEKSSEHEVTQVVEENSEIPTAEQQSEVTVENEQKSEESETKENVEERVGDESEQPIESTEVESLPDVKKEEEKIEVKPTELIETNRIN